MPISKCLQIVESLHLASLPSPAGICLTAGFSFTVLGLDGVVTAEPEPPLRLTHFPLQGPGAAQLLLQASCLPLTRSCFLSRCRLQTPRCLWKSG